MRTLTCRATHVVTVPESPHTMASGASASLSACAGTSGFIGEFLTLIGVFRANTWVALFAATGVILSAAYALWLYRRVIFGALEKENLKKLLDLSPREQLILYPLIALTILFGVYPAPIFDATAASVDLLVNNYTAALHAAQNVALSMN